MKHFIVLFIACILFPLITYAQISMHHADDTLEVKYTKDMLQGKLWEFIWTLVFVMLIL